MCEQAKPHKWAEVIKAWADGKEVEYFLQGKWIVYTGDGTAFCCLEWRIKPVYLTLGEIANRAWYGNLKTGTDNWAVCAEAVIEAYKKGEYREC